METKTWKIYETVYWRGKAMSRNSTIIGAGNEFAVGCFSALGGVDGVDSVAWGVQSGEHTDRKSVV